ncbi:MAG: SDR family oxidoreductase [Pseudomonadota bacterium]
MSVLEGKVALVTGGRSGIGRATADLLAARGARVFTAQRGEDDAHHGIRADLSDPDAAEAIFAEISARAGRLDILVNNAGLMREGTVLEMSAAEWTETLQVNLTAPFLLIKHALPLLIASGGAIVNVGSVEGLGANPRHPAYCASKAGLHGLTRAVAVDHGPQGIRCNAVAPGWIDTELNQAFIASQPRPATFHARLGTIHPIGRTGTAQEVASLICWLASPEAAFVTGQIFTVDGGRMAKLSLP